MKQIDEYHETVSTSHSPFHETKYLEKNTEFIKKYEEDTKDNKESIPIKNKADEKGYKNDKVNSQTWRPWQIKKEVETTQNTEDNTKVNPYEGVASATRVASFRSHCCGRYNTVNLDEKLPLNNIRSKCRCDQSAPIRIKTPYQINNMRRLGEYWPDNEFE